VGWWDRLVCRAHERAWRRRTGPCTFRREGEWFEFFGSFGFEVIAERGLSRWRNLGHPVRRRLYVLRAVGFPRRAKRTCATRRRPASSASGPWWWKGACSCVLGV